jgi:hypothetical protein
LFWACQEKSSQTGGRKGSNVTPSTLIRIREMDDDDDDEDINDDNEDEN